jgi:hypothetical protein
METQVTDKEYEPTADDVRYALIRVLMSRMAQDEKCSCCSPARCVLCLAMMSLGLEVWHDNSYRRELALRALIRDARLKSGLWRDQMSDLVESWHIGQMHQGWMYLAGELDVPDNAYDMDVRRWPRGLIEAKGGPGEIDRHGNVMAPPGWRQETDDEVRSRVNALTEKMLQDQEQRQRAEHPESFADEPSK